MDCNSLPQVMVSIAQRHDPADVVRAIVEGIARCEHVALARLWLVAPGDVCESCVFRDECPDRTRCLHLLASAGNSVDAQAITTKLDGRFRRFPLGVRKIGRVATTGEALLLSDLRGDESWIADPEWFRRERVRSFGAQPLVYRGDVLGVLALFDRSVLRASDFAWLRVYADHAAVAFANARMYDEIQRLRARLEEENSYLREEVTAALGCSELVGDSPSLRKLEHQIQLVAPTTAAVLISGESGTGKELVARAIHERSGRAGRALIKVNCSAIPESLFESEFFGHVRGAYTGALKDKLGRFELADGGTLFLDEIGEIPLSLQPKLLRALQEGEIERVGDTRTRKVDVRIVAATNRDLRAEVDARRFRQDLYYRLSVFPIDVPPLRERSSDIPRLVQHFVRRSAGELKRAAPRIPAAVLREFEKHDWPGNVRELENAVERAVILSGDGPLRYERPIGATTSITQTTGASNASQRAHDSDGARDTSMDDRIAAPRSIADLKHLERALIVDALRAANGRIFGADGAAERLGMQPTTLASRLKALRIDRTKPA